MNKEKQTYNPCDDCQYSYSKNGQESGMCKICEFAYFKDRKQSEPFSQTHENGGEWISVDERLPEENGRYLAFVDISHFAFENLTTIAIMAYGKSHGFYLYNDTEKVTHWMPLPEAPKKGGGA